MGQRAPVPDLPPPPPVPPPGRPRGRPKGSRNKARLSISTLSVPAVPVLNSDNALPGSATTSPSNAVPISVRVLSPTLASLPSGCSPVAGAAVNSIHAAVRTTNNPVIPVVPSSSAAAAAAAAAATAVPPTTEDAASKAKGRGPSFTPHEGLVLARAWVAQSAKGAYQREDSFWGDVEAYCSSHGVKRSRDSLKTQWRRMGRQCQAFINCRALVRSQRLPNQGPDNADDTIMNLYRQRMGRTDANGIYQYATPFKFVEAAEYLQQQPKFVDNYMKDAVDEAAVKNLMTSPTPADGQANSANMTVPPLDHDDSAAAAVAVTAASSLADHPQKDADGATTDRRDDDDVVTAHIQSRVSDAMVAAAVGANQSKAPEVIHAQDRERLKTRPIGMKRKKEVEQSEAESNRLENLMASMRDALVKANCLLEQVATETKEQNDMDNDIQLLQHLPRGTPDYDELLQSIVEKRRVRRRIEQQSEQHQHEQDQNELQQHQNHQHHRQQQQSLHQEHPDRERPEHPQHEQEQHHHRSNDKDTARDGERVEHADGPHATQPVEESNSGRQEPISPEVDAGAT